MSTEEVKQAVLDNLKGKEFTYHSKYGGYTDGVIKSAFFTQIVMSKEHKLAKTPKGLIKFPTGQLYFREELNIRSTNNIVYKYDEIFIKSESKTIFNEDVDNND